MISAYALPITNHHQSLLAVTPLVSKSSPTSPQSRPNASEASLSSPIISPSTATSDASGGAQTESPASTQAEIEAEELARNRKIIAELSARDREVKAHEQAHASVGGRYAGAPSYTYERGPDGVSYAVAGEVPIDIGREANPEATLLKAQVVRRAALAPANPSPQDFRVAAKASQLETQARADINAARVEASQVEQGVAADAESGEINDQSGQSSSFERGNSDNESTAQAQQSNTAASQSGLRLAQAVANTSVNENPLGSLLDQTA